MITDGPPQRSNRQLTRGIFGCNLLIQGTQVSSRLLKKLAARNVFLSAQPAAFGFKFFGVDGMRA
jgi:hypothetical protein